MRIDSFVNALTAYGIDFFSGVPDSLLKEFCDYIYQNFPMPHHHIVGANEGNCVALAAGYNIATGKLPCVYMQNSGLGNIINPVASLLNEKIYAIPCVFVVGWRGEPNVHDEPQHVFQGEITLPLLECVGITPFVIDGNTLDSQVTEFLSQSAVHFANGKSVAFVIKKGAFTAEQSITHKNDFSLKREKAIEIITNYSGDDLIVSTTGKASRELYEIRDGRGQGHGRDFLTVGSMGHSLSIALEIALCKKDKRVWCIDGDGALIMHMGGMATAGAYCPNNLVHVLINNHSHETVGGMPTVAGKIDFAAITKACGYKNIYSADSEDTLSAALQQINGQDGLTFIEVKCAQGSRKDLGRPKSSAKENKEAFIKFLNGQGE